MGCSFQYARSLSQKVLLGVPVGLRSQGLQKVSSLCSTADCLAPDRALSGMAESLF